MDILNQNGTTRQDARVRKGDTGTQRPHTADCKQRQTSTCSWSLADPWSITNHLPIQPDDDEKGHAAIFKVKFGRKSKTAITQLPQSRERTAEQLFDHLESVALAVAGNDDPSEPTAKCINDTKKGNWWPDLAFQS